MQEVTDLAHVCGQYRLPILEPQAELQVCALPHPYPVCWLLGTVAHTVTVYNRATIKVPIYLYVTIQLILSVGSTQLIAHLTRERSKTSVTSFGKQFIGFGAFRTVLNSLLRCSTVY